MTPRPPVYVRPHRHGLRLGRARRQNHLGSLQPTRITGLQRAGHLHSSAVLHAVQQQEVAPARNRHAHALHVQLSAAPATQTRDPKPATPPASAASKPSRSRTTIVRSSTDKSRPRRRHGESPADAPPPPAAPHSRLSRNTSTKTYGLHPRTTPPVHLQQACCRPVRPVRRQSRQSHIRHARDVPPARACTSACTSACLPVEHQPAH
ncbi:hypothetical protein Pcac1_g27398 [Phytophthora cactorum]|nr:hypothetical protein Pcac1_g27398 [Phytophthora cactorum]